MSRIILAALAAVALGSQTARAQSDSSIDTITIVDAFTTTYDGQSVDYFLLDIGDGQLMFYEDSAYVKCLGFIDAGDTSLLLEPIVWMKTTNPQVGDSWPGMLPFDDIVFTQEEIVGTRIVNVGAGSILVYVISVTDQFNRYLGEKWYANGKALVGWDIQRCNEYNSLELLGSSLSGGGFWPHALGNRWIYQSQSGRTSTQAPTATITVNGNGADWTSLSPMVQDTSGDDNSGFAGADIRNVSAAVDGSKLYMMATFWDGAPDTNWALAHTTAYAFLFDDDSLGNYWGYYIGYQPAPVSQWYVGGINMPAAGAQVGVGGVLEVSVPRANLGFYANELPFFAFAVDSGLNDVSCFNDVLLSGPAFCPITMTGDVQGDHNRSSADIVYLVNFVLKGGAAPQPCPAAGDVNCNGAVSTSDIIYMVNTVFKAGPVPCDACTIIPGLWSCP